MHVVVMVDDITLKQYFLFIYSVYPIIEIYGKTIFYSEQHKTLK